MGRPKRADDGGLIYHVLNRASVRMTIFQKDGDYEAFQRVLQEAVDRTRTQLVGLLRHAEPLAPIVWPQHDGELSRFVGWLTLTHTQRRHSHRHSRGSGHLCQGRFKSFPVQGDEHFFIACRSVERNTLRANLLERAEQWRWSSLYRRRMPKAVDKSWLADWPLERPRRWLSLVDGVETEAELADLRRSVKGGCPFGEKTWSDEMVRRLGLQTTVRSHGRPKKQRKDS